MLTVEQEIYRDTG